MPFGIFVIPIHYRVFIYGANLIWHRQFPPNHTFRKTVETIMPNPEESLLTRPVCANAKNSIRERRDQICLTVGDALG
jgi:hypothetical protein